MLSPFPQKDMPIAPMRMFICKVASRCNLDCDYCYVYHHVDQSWRMQPGRMAVDTAAQVGLRIQEHARTHGLAAVDVAMHGGEPLLAGLDHLQKLMDVMRENAPDVRIQFRMQTNGALLDERALELCIHNNLLVGLSMDGPAAANDRHRLDHRGRSSFDAVLRALRLLSQGEGRAVWSGFLTVIDLANEPLEVYEFLRSFRPRSIEFLFPLGHHDLRPPGKENLISTPYADWLLHVFGAWYRERPSTIVVRRFRDVIALMAGSQSSSEEWGLQPVDFAVIEVDGAIEAVDTLKVTYPGATRLGLNVFQNSFDEALESPHVRERQLGWATLCDTCRACPVARVCGGGYFPHRYSNARGFRNPSVYCADLQKLIRSLHDVVSRDLAALRAPSPPPLLSAEVHA